MAVMRLSALPLSNGGFSVTHATDHFSFAFLSLCFNTLDLQTGFFASTPPIATDTTLALAPLTIRSDYALLIAKNGTLAASQL